MLGGFLILLVLLILAGWATWATWQEAPNPLDEEWIDEADPRRTWNRI